MEKTVSAGKYIGLFFPITDETKEISIVRFLISLEIMEPILWDINKIPSCQLIKVRVLHGDTGHAYRFALDIALNFEMRKFLSKISQERIQALDRVLEIFYEKIAGEETAAPYISAISEEIVALKFSGDNPCLRIDEGRTEEYVFELEKSENPLRTLMFVVAIAKLCSMARESEIN